MLTDQEIIDSIRSLGKEANIIATQLLCLIKEYDNLGAKCSSEPNWEFYYLLRNKRETLSKVYRVLANLG